MLQRSIRILVALIAVVLVPTSRADQPDQRVRYDNYKLVRTQLNSQDQLQTMLSISQDHWTESAGIGPVEFSVSPRGMQALDASGIQYEVLIDNLQAMIDAERRRLDKADPLAAGGWFADFKDYDAANAYLNELAALRVDITEVFEVGTSLEGRAINAIRITGPGQNKPVVLLNGCQHAREWVAVMIPMYIADQLIREYGIDPIITDLVDRVEIVIIPIVNPDGYEYSWDVDRFWRKNRRPNGGGSFGVDLNRNWDFGWGGEGSSGNPNSQIYRGVAPFSEPESAAMRDFYQANPQIVANIDFHSYSQLVLQPWGYSPDLPDDHIALDSLGGEMASIITSVNGESYVNGPVYSILYPASGISIDWTYGDQGVFSYTIELRDQGFYGFVLPPEQIIPNAQEIFPAMLHLLEWSAPDNILGDLDGNGLVGASDLLILLANWGPCGDCDDCPADLDADCIVGASDLLILLANWG